MNSGYLPKTVDVFLYFNNSSICTISPSHVQAGDGGAAAAVFSGGVGPELLCDLLALSGSSAGRGAGCLDSSPAWRGKAPLPSHPY